MTNTNTITITLKDGRNVELVKVYNQNERFSGSVLIRFDGFRTSLRLTIKEFNELAKAKDKIK
tara:strand:- start:63 stop:251 length:189 start_codon:yes stop_codon:yes gene_type:complete